MISWRPSKEGRAVLTLFTQKALEDDFFGERKGEGTYSMMIFSADWRILIEKRSLKGRSLGQEEIWKDKLGSSSNRSTFYHIGRSAKRVYKPETPSEKPTRNNSTILSNSRSFHQSPIKRLVLVFELFADGVVPVG